MSARFPRGRPRNPAPDPPTCRHCGVRLIFFRGFWRDTMPDPGDGYGGDASCPARRTVAGRAQPHESADKPSLGYLSQN